MKEFRDWIRELWAFIKTWSKTAWFLIITSILYVVLAVYLRCVVGHPDGIEIAQIAYVFVLSVGLVIRYTVNNSRK